MTSYFIYYRVAPRHVHDLAKAVGEVQAALRNATGVNGRLMRRDDATDTWMEIYEGIGDPAGFETELKRAVASAKFDTLLADGTQRHVERFVEA
jgi:hypothetical protein